MLLLTVQSISPSPTTFFQSNQNSISSSIQISDYKFQFFLSNRQQNYNEVDVDYDEKNNIQFSYNLSNLKQLSQQQVSHHLDIIEEYRKYHRLPINPTGTLIVIQISLKLLDSPIDYKNIYQPENYIINISSNSSSQQVFAKFYCHGYISFLRALESFAQLIHKENSSIQKIPIFIEDAPSYPHRGIMIDTSRWFIPLAYIESTLRGMQINKLNVLHLHITDSESFPLFIPSIPKLSEYGAYSSKEIFTPDQLKNLVLYGQKRGVLIIPEVDQPSHTRSWAIAPEYQIINSCYNYPKDQWEEYCRSPPCGQLNPTLEKTYSVAQAIMRELQTSFTSDYLHMGGDEVVDKCWDFTPSIKTWMGEHNISNYKQLFEYYFKRVDQFVEPQKRKIFWFSGDQVGIEYPPNTILQFWGKEDQYDILKNVTNQVILSTYNHLYLDCGTGNLLGDEQWCDPYKTWNRVYSFKPKKSNIGSRLLGAEVSLWGELIPPTYLDYKTWPRASAFALRMWNEDEQLNQPELVQKLGEINKNLFLVGIKPGPVTDQYCQDNINMCFFDLESQNQQNIDTDIQQEIVFL